jgi:hypothetical protein
MIESLAISVAGNNSIYLSSSGFVGFSGVRFTLEGTEEVPVSRAATMSLNVIGYSTCGFEWVAILWIVSAFEPALGESFVILTVTLVSKF